LWDFSIAYAFALCLDKQPGSVIFDQQLMREHLYTCIQQHFSIFQEKITQALQVLKFVDCHIGC